MTFYLIMSASFFIVALIGVCSTDISMIRWIPELAIISLFWPLVILCGIINILAENRWKK